MVLWHSVHYKETNKPIPSYQMRELIGEKERVLGAGLEEISLDGST